MTSPAVDEYGEIVDSSSGIGEYGRFYFGNWSEDGVFRIGVWVTQMLGEVVGLVDYRSGGIQKIVDEGVGVLDEVVVTPLKMFAEALDIDDKVVEWLHSSTKLMVEYIGLMDGEIKRDMSRVVTEIFEIGRDLAKISEWGHVMVEGGVSEVGRWWENELEEEGNVLNEVYKGEVLERYVVKGLVESISHWHGWPLREIGGRVLIDNVMLDDIGLFEKIRVLIEALGLSDVIGYKGVGKSIVDGVGVVGSISKNVTKGVLEEIVDLIDVFIRGKEKIFEEMLSLTDSGRLVGVGRTRIESVGIVDISVRDVLKGILEEVVELLDVIKFGGDYWKMVVESIGMTDGIGKFVSARRSESVGVVDVRNVVVTKGVFVEALGISDIVEAISKNLKMLVEALGLGDVVNRSPMWHVYDEVRVVDVISKQPFLERFVETMGALVDVISSRGPGLVRVDVVNVSDEGIERTLSIVVRELVTMVGRPIGNVVREVEEIVEIVDIVKRMFRNKVRRMAGVVSRTKMGAFVKRKVHNTFKKIGMDSTFWSGDDKE